MQDVEEKKAIQRTCSHCGHGWIQRKTAEKKPLQCPRCKSFNWDNPKPVGSERLAEKNKTGT